MFDLIEKGFIGDKIDACALMFFNTEIVAEKILKQLQKSRSFMTVLQQLQKAAQNMQSLHIAKSPD